MAVLAEVPSKYDIALTVGATTTGFKFLDTLDGSYLSASRHKAEYTATPTFVERQNVSAAYGDDQQAFFLTTAQRDWSLGEDQAHFHFLDNESVRKFLVGANVDVSIEGQVTIALAPATATAASQLKGAGSYPPSGQSWTSTATNLIEVDSTGAQTDRGAHGAGTWATAYACDGVNLYISGAGCTSVRRYNLAAHTFNAFCATAMDSLCYLNNTLYGTNGGTFYSISTAGVTASLFPFKDILGAALTGALKVVAYGGKVLVLKTTGAPGGAELWNWDGTAMSKLGDFPPNFTPYDICVNLGIVYIIGTEGFGSVTGKEAIYTYTGSTFVLAYRSTQPSPGGLNPNSVCPFGEGVAFIDYSIPTSVSGLRLFDPAAGTSTVYQRLFSSGTMYLAGTNSYLLVVGNSPNTTSAVWPAAGQAATTSAKLYTSRYDFESSLPKLMRGVILLFDLGEDGNGGSVDLGYFTTNVNTVTSLATGVTSTAEVLFPANTKLIDVGLVITLNKGTSTLGPVLKRIYLRAAPILQGFRVRTYNLDLTATPGLPTSLRDGTTHPLTGFEQAQNLQTAIASQVPITVKDKFGTYTGVCEPGQCSIFELHADSGAGGSEATPGQFSATVVIREV